MVYIDLHTHGISGRDARATDPDAYLEMAEAYYANGTGAFVATLFPGPVPEMRAQLAAIKKAMEMQGAVSLADLKSAIRDPKSAILLGAHLEGPFVNPAKCGALDPSSFIEPSIDDFARLVDGYEVAVRMITIAPELPDALSVIEAAVSRGIRVNMGHSAAAYHHAADGARAGATGVTHLFNAMSGIHHRKPGLAGYALTDDSLYVELIADMVHVHPQILMIALKCKPPDRIILVSDSLDRAKTGGAPAHGPIYMSDGVTLAGSGITLADAVSNMASLGVPGQQAALFASSNPATYLGI